MENVEKYSYSKLSTYKDCPYKFKLIYIDKNFIDSSSIATCFGTLIHYIEECIANDIKNNISIDYDKYIDLFINIDDEKEKIYGVKKLKSLFPDDFYKADKSGMKYSEKCAFYVNEAIYRLEDYFKANPYLEVVSAEQEFNLFYENENHKYIFHGFIDRIFRNKLTNEYIIEDIKTYSKKIEDKDLVTPLQFVFYTLALKEMFNINEDQIRCAYDLPLCSCKQGAGTKGFLNRGIKKINSLLNSIELGNFKPQPSPLCHWCHFCETYPNQPKEAKNLCPYFSKWTPDNKIHDVEYMWMGKENHDEILTCFRNKDKVKEEPKTYINDTEHITNRFFRLRIV